MGDTYRNIARDEAQVGIQIGVAHGPVNQSNVEGGPSIEQQLIEIRRLLRQAAENGWLETEFVELAARGLELAEQADGPSPSRRERLLRALGTVQAAVTGVSGLTAAVDGLITSVHRLA